MAVGDRVEATKNIQTIVTEGLTMAVSKNGIPRGEQGIIEVEDPKQGVVSVLFDNGIRGNFGETLVDKLDSIRRLPAQTKARDLMAEAEFQAEATASFQASKLRTSRGLPGG